MIIIPSLFLSDLKAYFSCFLISKWKQRLDWSIDFRHFSLDTSYTCPIFFFNYLFCLLGLFCISSPLYPPPFLPLPSIIAMLGYLFTNTIANEWFKNMICPEYLHYLQCPNHHRHENSRNEQYIICYSLHIVISIYHCFCYWVYSAVRQ